MNYYKTRLLIVLARLYEKTGEHGKVLYLVNQALNAARRNGAAKHEASALWIKGGIIFPGNSKKGRECLERAHELSEKMGAQCFVQRIGETWTDLEHQEKAGRRAFL